jgi:hypothetical protein
VRTARTALLLTRVLLAVITAGAAGCVAIGYAHAESLTAGQADVITLVPAAVFGTAVFAHVRQRHRARRAGLVGGRRWIDVVVCVIVAVGAGLGISYVGFAEGGAAGDLVFDAGLGLAFIAIFASPLGWLLALSFVDGPIQLARTVSRRAGWYLVMVMAAVYLLAIALTTIDNADDPPALLGRPGAIIYATVIAIGVVLIVEQTQQRETGSGPSGKNHRDHDRSGRDHLDR